MSLFLAEPTSISSLITNTIFQRSTTTVTGFHSGQLPACSTVVTALTAYPTSVIPCGNAFNDYWFRLRTGPSVMTFTATNLTSKSSVRVSLQFWTVMASMAFLSAVLAVKFNSWPMRLKGISLPFHGLLKQVWCLQLSNNVSRGSSRKRVIYWKIPQKITTRMGLTFHG